jgi:leader peptidase (prepilin peptidase)/N-methyltransferase
MFFTLLFALALIDWDSHLLPDVLTLPLMWAGLIYHLMAARFAVFPEFQSFEPYFWGAIFGYLSLWFVAWLFKRVTGRIGMGEGDFKLMAAVGAWMGYSSLLPIIAMASIAHAIIGIAYLIVSGKDKQTELPMGPALIAGVWMWWIALGTGNTFGMERLFSL